MQLWPSVHLVGSGRNGFDLTDPFDCHVYLIESENEAALVDAGAGTDMDPLVREIESTIDTDKLKYLILSHKHADHAGGAAHLKERYNLEVIGSEHTAQVVGEADEELLSLVDAKQAGGYPRDYVFHPCSVDRVVAEGDTILVGSIRLQVVETPGHCEGHLSLLGEVAGRRTLFSSDSLFHGGRVVWQTTYDCSVQEHVNSIRKLDTLHFDALLPGHMLFSLTGGKRHVEAAMARIATMDVPAHLV